MSETNPATGTHLPEPRSGKGFWVLMFLSMAFVGFVAYLQYARVKMARTPAGTVVAPPQELPNIATVPDFTFTDETGKRVQLSDLRGKVWVANFIFTRCQGPCPAMTAQMAELQGTFKSRGYNDVTCVSFSVDPEYDTPQKLAAYAEAFGAERSRWIFLTGEKKPLREFVIKGMKIAVEDPPVGDDQVLHSTKFVVVDKKGVIRGFFDGLVNDPDWSADDAASGSSAALLEAVARLRHEGPQ